MFNESLFLLSCVAMVAVIALCLRHSKETLMCCVGLQGIFANFFVLKQITVFGLHVTASDVFTIGAMVGLNLIQERFGASWAKNTVVTGIIMMVCFLFFSQIHLLYQSSPFDHTQAAYAQLLTPSVRLIAVSILVLYLVQYLDIRVYGLLRQKFRCSILWASLIALCVCQGLDTLLFSLFGLYGLVENVMDVFWFSYAIKLLIIMTLVPLNSVCAYLTTMSFKSK